MTSVMYLQNSGAALFACSLLGSLARLTREDDDIELADKCVEEMK
jgi:hypothetical protein